MPAGSTTVPVRTTSTFDGSEIRQGRRTPRYPQIGDEVYVLIWNFDWVWARYRVTNIDFSRMTVRLVDGSEESLRAICFSQEEVEARIEWIKRRER